MSTSKINGNNRQEGATAPSRRVDVMAGAELQGEDDRPRAMRPEQERVLRGQAADAAEAKLADANAATKAIDARFSLLVNGVKDYALLMLDPAGNVASWNAGAEHIKGYKAEEILGKNFSVFYEAADVNAGHPQRNLALAKETGRAEEEGRRVKKDGTTFWANVVLAPLRDAAGALLGFAQITRDLTERRHLEEQLRQSQKMEAIGSLAAGVAHDFNNLLSVILSYSEMMAVDLQYGRPQRSDLAEITAAGLRASDLTRQLLAFSRQQVLQPRIEDLSAIVSGMEGMLRRLIGEDIELATTCMGPTRKVLVDPRQMEQVIMNLVVNARDAMPQGGKITIETKEVILDEAYASEHMGVKAGPHVMLAVSDTGLGMSEATLARMYEPFFTTKENGKGTGLGLATVFGIIKQSCGSILASSELEHGSTFKIYLPMFDQSAVVGLPAAPLDRAALYGSETILLVEDDERVRVLATTILRRYGYIVLVAGGGGDALLLSEQYAGTIDLLLTDVVMPRMSGRELAQRLTPLRPAMKILYMSGYTDDAIVRHGVLHSTISFIQKPITPQTLARKVRETLSAACLVHG